MRRSTTAALAAVALTVGLAAPAAAHPTQDVLPPLGVDLTHESTDNVGFVARFHEHFGSAGGIKTSNDWNDGAEFFVVTDPRGVFTYDVANPEAPELLGFLLNPQSENITNPALGQEDPSTDGRTLLLDGTNPLTGQRGLQIISIEDPTAPKVLGRIGTTDHTWTCVSDQDGNGCAYAYGRSDNIIDIRDPAKPVKVTPGWKSIIGDSNYTHDLTEIRPGLVMSAGAKPVLLDTTDPANPIELVRIDENDHKRPGEPMRNFSSLGYHSVEWHNGGQDDFLVAGTEIAGSNAGSDCDGTNGQGNSDNVIETWDATAVRAALAEYDALIADGATRKAAADLVFGADRDKVNFALIDSFDATGRGLFVDGQAPGHVLYCAHWMEKNPSWENGGTLAVGYYNRGVRFVEVDSDGMMEEIGWFVGADAYTGSAQWIDDSVVYVMDYVRGMDVVKLAPTEATGTYTGTGSVHDNALTIAELEAMGIAPPVEESAAHGVLTMVGLALAAAAALRRRVTA